MKLNSTLRQPVRTLEHGAGTPAASEALRLFAQVEVPPADTRRFDFHLEVFERRDPRLEVQRLGGGNIRAVLKDPGCPLDYGAKDN